MKKIASIIVETNSLVAFKFEGEELLDWSKDLDRLLPDRELKKLPFLMDCFKTTAIIWNKQEGIQNIFRGLKEIEFKEGKYQIVTNWPG